MGVRTTSGEHKCAWFDSTSGIAFGPVFDDLDEADAFERFAMREANVDDVRAVSSETLAELHGRFLREEWDDGA